MKSISTEWFFVEDCMPPHDLAWRIVRAVHSDTSFYFMAYFSHEDNKWNYYDDDDESEKRSEIMTVTHWCNIDEPRFLAD